MRVFETGATRDSDDTKPRYTGYLSPEVLKAFGRFMLRHQTQADGVARASDNWKRGIPRGAYLDSGVRHMIDLWHEYESGIIADEVAEELCCAILFNVQGFLFETIRKRNE